jgi:hypothetical protein
MKEIIMKIQTLVAAALLAAFATSTASAAKLDLTSTNNSDGAIAVGDTFVAAGAIIPGVGAGGLIAGAGGRAVAGSVMLNVKGCGCKRKVTITNSGADSIAVGNATAGSTSLTMM